MGWSDPGRDEKQVIKFAWPYPLYFIQGDMQTILLILYTVHTS